jgi:hypothetical protein
MQDVNIPESLHYEIYRLDSVNKLLGSILLSSMDETETTNAMWVINDTISQIISNMEELCGSLIIQSEESVNFEYEELQNVVHSWVKQS